MRKKLPIGIDGFEKIRTNDFYYADKTLFIKELLQNWGEVNLFTRPRRFGKTLNMSMLKSFFETGKDPALKERIRHMFRIMLRDNVKARIQMPDGNYVRVERGEGEEPLNSQEYFFEEAYRAAAGNAEA